MTAPAASGECQVSPQPEYAAIADELDHERSPQVVVPARVALRLGQPVREDVPAERRGFSSRAFDHLARPRSPITWRHSTFSFAVNSRQLRCVHRSKLEAGLLRERDEFLVGHRLGEGVDELHLDVARKAGGPTERSPADGIDRHAGSFLNRRARRAGWTSA